MVSLILVPDLGDLFRLQPQFNAATVVELLRRDGVSQLLWATSDDPDHPLRDALSATKIGIREGFAPDWQWAESERAELESYLNQYPQGRERMRDAARAEQALAEVLTSPLSAANILGADVLDAAQTYHTRTRELLDEGPGNLWRQKRLEATAAALAGQSGAVLAPLDDLPALLELLPDAKLIDLAGFQAGESSRLRALADRAWQLHEEDDLTALLEALEREKGDTVTPKAELDAAAANIYLSVGELGAAREKLERAAHSLTDEMPLSLAGLVLARLGQVRDALGERELALRTYRAVLALAYAPAIARETAETGISTPFLIENKLQD